MNIHPQLLADCHHLGQVATGSLLLHRNAGLPWFILVPATEHQDLLDLPVADLSDVMADAARLSSFLKTELGYGKVNFAGLGNQVPQMHLHIIGRRDDDPCWPQPVWGNLPEGPEYDDATLAEWQVRLVRDLGLEPPP